MEVDLKFEGMAQFNAAIAKLIKTMDPEKVEPLLQKGAKVIADAAKAKAPKGPSGNLKKAIKVKRMERRGNQPAPYIAAVDRKRAPHAHLVEYGYPGIRIAKRGRFKGKQFGRMPAKPFFRPAVDAKQGEVAFMVQAGLKKLVEEAVK